MLQTPPRKSTRPPVRHPYEGYVRSCTCA